MDKNNFLDFPTFDRYNFRTLMNADSHLSFQSLLKFIWTKRNGLIIAGIAGAVLSALLSYLLPVYFKSSVTIFPSRTNSLVLNEAAIRRGNISDIGDEEEAEQLLQIIESDELINRVIEKNDLYIHYEINQDDKHSRTNIYNKYHSNVNAKRTKYNSINISVRDKQPQKAAEIANSISDFIDVVKNKMIKERASNSVQVLEREIWRVQNDLDSILLNINKLSDQGVVSENERASLFQAYGEAVRSSSSRAIAKLEQKIEINRQLGDEFDLLKRYRDQKADYIISLEKSRDQMITDANLSIPQKFTVDRAVPADKKSYPVRWLVVVFGTGVVVLSYLLIMLVRDFDLISLADVKGSE